MSTILKKRFKSPNPALSVHQSNEDVATNTIYSDTPATDGGEKCAQFFVGTDLLLTDVYGIKTPAQFPGTLLDNITVCGAPKKLLSN